MHRVRVRLLSATSAALATLVVAGCAGVDADLESGSARGTAAGIVSETAAPVSTDPAGPAPLIDTASPSGRMADTVIGWLNSPETFDPAAIDGAASPALARDLAPNTLSVVLAQVTFSGPFTVTGSQQQGDGTSVALTTARGVPATLEVAVDEANLIQGIRIQADSPAVTSFDDADSALAALGASTSFAASRVTDGECAPVHTQNPDQPLALASVVKLYVLGALARAVADGETSWDEQLTIDDATKSAPSGELQDRPDGSTVTVREAADKMVSLSDNTATDLIIDRLGREAVENEVAVMGHHDPASLAPFPTTRELLLIGWGTPDERDAWRTATQQQRADILDRQDTRPLDLDTEALALSPAAADGVDWFGTARDICSAYAALITGPESDTVRRILAINPGIDLDRAQWPYVGFKGGNLPGVLAGSWLATDASGQDWVVSTQLESNTAIGGLETGYAFDIARQAFSLVP